MATESNAAKTAIDLDALEALLYDPTPDVIEVEPATWANLIAELREKRDRLAVLDDPGTPTAILNGMFAAAEALGHPKYSSSHALGFLLDLIEKQQGELAEWRDLYPGETPEEAAEHYVS